MGTPVDHSDYKDVAAWWSWIGIWVTIEPMFEEF